MVTMNRSANLVLMLVMLLAATGNAANLRDSVRQAKDDGKEVSEVTRQLILSGEHPANVAQAVANVYDNCEDISTSVSTAIDGQREYLESVVSSVSALDACGCNADTLWSRSRLEARLRVPVTRVIVELDQDMACAAVASEAASSHYAEESGQIVEAAMRGKQPVAIAYDTFGSLDYEEASTSPTVAYRRKPDSCGNDQELNDEFDRNRYWQTFNATGTPRPSWEPDCGDDRDREEKTAPASDLLISEVSFGKKDSSFVAIYNSTDQPLDLKALNVSLTVFFNGSDKPGLMIPLEGEVPPKGHYVTAGPAFNENQVDQVQSGFQLDSNDTIAIIPPVETYDCDGFRSVLGGALRGSVQNVDDPESHDYNHPVSLVKDKVSRFLGAVDGKTPGYVADAVGQVPLDEDDVPLPNLSDELSRMPTACDSDSNETDRFSQSGSWSTTAARSLGQPNTRCGETTKNGMLISELANGDGQQDAIEIFNATNSTIDLDDEGYMLEIYRDGSEQPDQVINLDGQIGPSGVFVIANYGHCRPIDR
jgi:hypothetical protein